MSAVLQAPTLPTLINLEDVKTFIQSEIDKAMNPVLQKIDELKEENIKIREENVRLLRHIRILEGHLNINYTDYEDVCLTGNTYEDLKDEGITPFCDKIEQITIKATDSPHSADTSNLPTCVTDARADLLLTHMETNELVPKVNSGAVNLECRLCNRKEFRYFVEHVLEPEYRPKNLKNLRKLKKDLFENAAHRHPDKACIDQAFHGNKELRLLVYKEIPIPESIINMFSPQPLQAVTQ